MKSLQSQIGSWKVEESGYQVSPKEVFENKEIVSRQGDLFQLCPFPEPCNDISNPSESTRTTEMDNDFRNKNNTYDIVKNTKSSFHHKPPEYSFISRVGISCCQPNRKNLSNESESESDIIYKSNKKLKRTTKIKIIDATLYQNPFEDPYCCTKSSITDTDSLSSCSGYSFDWNKAETIAKELDKQLVRGKSVEETEVLKGKKRNQESEPILNSKKELFFSSNAKKLKILSTSEQRRVQDEAKLKTNSPLMINSQGKHSVNKPNESLCNLSSTTGSPNFKTEVTVLVDSGYSKSKQRQIKNILQFDNNLKNPNSSHQNFAVTKNKSVTNSEEFNLQGGDSTENETKGSQQLCKTNNACSITQKKEMKSSSESENISLQQSDSHLNHRNKETWKEGLITSNNEMDQDTSKNQNYSKETNCKYLEKNAETNKTKSIDEENPKPGRDPDVIKSPIDIGSKSALCTVESKDKVMIITEGCNIHHNKSEGSNLTDGQILENDITSKGKKSDCSHLNLKVTPSKKERKESKTKSVKGMDNSIVVHHPSINKNFGRNSECQEENEITSESTIESTHNETSSGFEEIIEPAGLKNVFKRNENSLTKQSFNNEENFPLPEKSLDKEESIVFKKQSFSTEVNAELIEEISNKENTTTPSEQSFYNSDHNIEHCVSDLTPPNKTDSIIMTKKVGKEQSFNLSVELNGYSSKKEQKNIFESINDQEVSGSLSQSSSELKPVSIFDKSCENTDKLFEIPSVQTKVIKENSKSKRLKSEKEDGERLKPSVKNQNNEDSVLVVSVPGVNNVIPFTYVDVQPLKGCTFVDKPTNKDNDVVNEINLIPPGIKPGETSPKKDPNKKPTRGKENLESTTGNFSVINLQSEIKNYEHQLTFFDSIQSKPDLKRLNLKLSLKKKSHISETNEDESLFVNTKNVCDNEVNSIPRKRVERVNTNHFSNFDDNTKSKHCMEKPKTFSSQENNGGNNTQILRQVNDKEKSPPEIIMCPNTSKDSEMIEEEDISEETRVVADINSKSLKRGKKSEAFFNFCTSTPIVTNCEKQKSFSQQQTSNFSQSINKTNVKGLRNNKVMSKIETNLIKGCRENNENSDDSLSDSQESTNKGLNGPQLLETILDEIQCHMISSNEELRNLEALNIKITWELPKLHELDNGSYHMTFKRLLRKLGSDKKLLSRAKFTKEEEVIIINNWKEFSKEYGFSNPELFMPSFQLHGSFKIKERLKFKQFLAKGLPNRRLFSVYTKFIDMFTVSSRGRWTEKEDRLLMDLYRAYDEEEGEAKYGMTRNVILQKALGRTPISVQRRLQILLKDSNDNSLSKEITVKNYWTPKLEGRLIHYLLKYTKCVSLEELRCFTINDKVWEKIASKLDCPFRKVLEHWTYSLQPQLFAERPLYRHQLFSELILWFHRSTISNWNKVDWADLSERTGHLGSGFLYRCFRTLVNNYVPRNLHKNLRACVKHLHEVYLPKLCNKSKPRVLKRIRYNADTRLVEEREDPDVECVLFKIE